jgi:hypothetical protein
MEKDCSYNEGAFEKRQLNRSRYEIASILVADNRY